MSNVAAGNPGASAQQLFTPAGWRGEGQPPLYTATQIAALVEAQQPAPTPQADSQPALDEATAMSRTRELAESCRWPSDWVEAYRRGYSDRAARAQADSVTAPAGGRENLDLRRMLCVAHAGAAAYMDDGEAQDSRDLPVIDFLRDTPAEIQDKLQRRALKKLAAGATAPPAQAADSVLEDAARLEALHAAVTAIYLDDSSDFKSALGAVVRHLDPKLAGDLLAWPKRAYDISQARLDAARKQGANHD